MYKSAYAVHKVRSIELDDEQASASKEAAAAAGSSEDGEVDDVDLESAKPKSSASLFHFAKFPHDLIYLLPAFVATMLSGAAKPIQSILLGKVFTALGNFASGALTKQQFLHEATKYTMSIVGVGGALLVIDWAMLACFDLFSATILKRARRQMFVRFLNRDFAWYDLNKGVMGTLTTLNRCFSDLQSATTLSLALFVQSIFTILACLAISFYYSWSVALVSLAVLPIMLVVTTVGSKFITTYFYQFKAVLEDACTLVDWSFNSIVTVKQFNGQHDVTKKFSGFLNQATAFYFKFAMAAGIQQGVSRFFILGMFVPVFVFGARLVHNGTIEVGAVLTVFWCSFMISGSVGAMGLKLESLNKGRVASARIKDFLDMGVSSVTYFKNMIGIFPETCHGSVVFQKVRIIRIFRLQELLFFLSSISFANKNRWCSTILLDQTSRSLTDSTSKSMLASLCSWLVVPAAVNQQFPTLFFACTTFPLA